MSPLINSAALSAAIMTPICGLTVSGATMLPSTTCRFRMPITLADSASTHAPSLHEPLQ